MIAITTLALAPLETSLGGTEGPNLTRYLLACGFVLLLAVGLAWGFRRIARRTLRHRAAQRSMQVMDVLPMGGKQRLTVVRCYDRTFLLGLGDREMSLVAELDPVVAPETEPLASAADQAAFADTLERLGAVQLEPERAQARPAEPKPATPKRAARAKGRGRMAPGGILG